MYQWQTVAYQRLNADLSGVLGSKATRLSKVGWATAADLCEIVPRSYLSGSDSSDLSKVRVGDEVALALRVAGVRQSGRPPRFRLEATLTDGHNRIAAVFFGKRWLIDYWSTELGCGSHGIFVGKISRFRNSLQITHPQFVMLDDAGEVVGRGDKSDLISQVARSGLIGLYRATGGLPTWTIGAGIDVALQHLEGIPEPLPDWVVAAADVVPLGQAYQWLHQPDTLSQAVAGEERLRFNEALALSLVMAYRRAETNRQEAVPRPLHDASLVGRFDEALPYRITDGQAEVGGEIASDLASATPMHRLLQGEVGSGKTLVALRAMLQVVDSGAQAVLLAPTEVLARQHYLSLQRLLGPLLDEGLLAAGEVSVTLLTGATAGASRREALRDIASGDSQIIVGTHALLGKDVAFSDLGLVVVDEQHRFGVEQRAALVAGRTPRPHLLVMTATPIPRTVALTCFGDLQVSTLRELPARRAEVSTTLVNAVQSPTWLDRVWDRVREEIAAGRQGFVVCPRITGNSKGPIGLEAAVDDVAERLRTGPLEGLRIEVLHGQLPASEAAEIMDRFVAGDIDCLVSTTVIEVGVDVANASFMVICDADSFGVSQLHQLRGRIGRGVHPGVCLLLTGVDPQSSANDRLAQIAQTNDGFALAELDLLHRGEGQLLGEGQSGSASLRFIRIAAADRSAAGPYRRPLPELIDLTREIADEIVRRYPDAEHPGIADMLADFHAEAAAEWLDKA